MNFESKEQTTAVVLTEQHFAFLIQDMVLLALTLASSPADGVAKLCSHLGFILAPKSSISKQLSDLAVSLSSPAPLQEILQDKDGLNQRYFRKRALYLAHLAHHLAKDTLFGSVRFSYTNGCHLKPSLLLRPHGRRHTLGGRHSMG